MIIALVDFDVAPERCSALLADLKPLLEEARAMAGNISYRALIDGEEKAHIDIMHEWESLERFRDYRSSNLFSRMSQLLRPAMTSPPVSRCLQAESFEEVHG